MKNIINHLINAISRRTFTGLAMAGAMALATSSAHAATYVDAATGYFKATGKLTTRVLTYSGYTKTVTFNAEARYYVDGRISVKVTDSNWMARPGAMCIDSAIDYWSWGWWKDYVPGAAIAASKTFNAQNAGAHLQLSQTNPLKWANNVIDTSYPTDNWGSQAASSYVTTSVTVRPLVGGTKITLSFTSANIMTVQISGSMIGNILGATFQER